jgi:hypothetical protein
MKTKPKRTYDYPEDTEGTRLAAQARAECNQLSREEKRRLLELGMKLAYGLSPKQKVGAGH